MPTMPRTAEVKTRTTAQIKADAAAVYARWGISLSDAINIFLAKSIEVGGLPFDMRPETPGQVLWSGVIVLCPSGWVMR